MKVEKKVSDSIEYSLEGIGDQRGKRREKSLKRKDPLTKPKGLTKGHRGPYLGKNLSKPSYETDGMGRRRDRAGLGASSAISISSIVDYPHVGLPADVWVEVNGLYKLKPTVKKDIVDRIGDFCKRYQIWGFVNSLFLASSVTTSYYTQFSDIDVKVMLDLDSYKKFLDLSDKDDEDFLTTLIQYVRKDPTIVDTNIKGTNRELDVYFKTDEFYNVDYSDGVYDILEDKWIKEPLIVDLDMLSSEDMDLESRFKRGFDMAMEWAESWDLSLGQIDREIKEFYYISDFLASLPVKYLKKFKEMLLSKLETLEKAVTELVKEREDVGDQRHDVFDVSTELPDYHNSINWFPENIQFKLLQRWGYFAIISELKSLLKGGLSLRDIDDIKTAVQRGADVE